MLQEIHIHAIMRTAQIRRIFLYPFHTMEAILEGIGQLFKTLWSVWAEMFTALLGILPKLVSFILWVLAAVIILPCVLVSNHYFPKWVEWGEGF